MDTNIWDQLSVYFNLHIQQQGKAVCTVGGEALTEKAAMQRFLTAYGDYIEAEELSVAAAYFVSWFGDVAAALLYSVSVHNTAPNLTLTNLQVHLIPEQGFTRIAFQLSEDQLDHAPGERQTVDWTVWREQVFSRFYKDTVSPLLLCVSEASGIQAGILWGQLPTSLQNYREKLQALLSTQDNASLLAYLAEDDAFMCNNLAPEVFGRAKNPLQAKVRFLDHPLEAGKKLAIKNTCCLQYKRTNRSYCYTCPRLSKKDRMNWLQQS
ncbi:IucA/IucC family C-terminal-domain containing protein [Paenibacillus sp. NPDC057934]|uniref:IucA/IucC family C-terminal-domain containing protein n=1 Tax=Paenibacillus sp. NPDC057934 TaxID=3346282 RepID=UPI0036DBDADD